MARHARFALWVFLLLRVDFCVNGVEPRTECAREEEAARETPRRAKLAVRHDRSRSQTQDGQREKFDSLENIRVLLYITTHVSPLHVKFLQKCWKGIIASSALLQHADVLFFVAKPLPVVLKDIFGDKHVRVEQYRNPGYQSGAKLAMETATAQGWFDGYDWVIRVNPDVLILEDEWLIRNMLDDNVDGIFADCHDGACTSHCKPYKTNSDFFAVRSRHLGPETFAGRLPKKKVAEVEVTAAFKNIFEQGRDRWIPGTSMHGTCRVRGSRVPVVHAHSLVKQCPLAKGQPVDRNIRR